MMSLVVNGPRVLSILPLMSAVPVRGATIDTNVSLKRLMLVPHAVKWRPYAVKAICI